MIKIKFKKLYSCAKMPEKVTEGAGCYDLWFLPPPNEAHRHVIGWHSSMIISIGISVEIPKGYRGVLTARSSQSSKDVLVLPGVIDSDYRGDIGPRIWNAGKSNYVIERGDRIAQFHIEKVEDIEWVEVEELSETVRGDKGFGSTGR